MSQSPSRVAQCLRAAAFSLAISFGSFSTDAAAQLFTGAGGGAIADNSSVATAVTFDASGLTGRVRSIRIGVDLQHSYVGDLTVQLTSPNGLARLKLFGRVGARFGIAGTDSSNLSGLYVFSDTADVDFWAAAAAVTNPEVIAPNAHFRTSVAGVPGRGLGGGCSSHLNLAFGGLSAAQANGTWVVTVTDSAAGDVGTVTATSSALQFFMEEPALFYDGFESGPRPPAPIVASSVTGACTPAINSPTGSGLTDFVMARANNGAVDWTVKTNDLTATGAVLPVVSFGLESDFFLMGDFDGDGLSDFTVWRAGNPGRFLVRRSSRPTDVPLEVNLGAIGGIPKVIADYDGDRVTDFAVYKSAAIGQPGVLQIRLSSSGNTAVQSFINAEDALPAALRDVSGDGKADFVLQSNGGANVGLFRVFNGSNGAAITSFNLGLSSDFFFPGQVAGSAATDITISRNKFNPVTSMTEKMFQTRDSASAAVGVEIFNGISGDFITPGDYDGDGLIDYAVWRSSTTPALSKFVIRRSSLPATALEVFIGASGDYPVANWDVH